MLWIWNAYSRESSWFQSINPSCIDLILISKELFKNSDVSEVGISDHRRLIVTVLLRSRLAKGNAKNKVISRLQLV